MPGGSAEAEDASAVVEVFAEAARVGLERQDSGGEALASGKRTTS
jgi:hypothetical protein